MQDVLALLCSYWWLAFIFLAFGGGFFAGAKSLIHQWRQAGFQARRREQENDLKRDMVAKGFSPAEIERVIQARPGGAMPSAAGDDVQLPKSLAHGFGSGAEMANLVAALAEQGMDAEGIERIVKALGESADDELLHGKVAAVHRLAEEGMDAKGIERVIRAFPPPAAPRGTEKANLVAALAEQGMEAEGIDRIVKALGESADDELHGKVAAVHRLAEQGKARQGKNPRTGEPMTIPAKPLDAEEIERVIRAFPPPAAPRGKDDTAIKE
jgi:SOS response regulatory protein OraA/RecX